MGICETKNNSNEINNNTNYYSTNDLAMQNEKGKYFNQDLRKQNSLVITNDVIVSDAHENIDSQ